MWWQRSGSTLAQVMVCCLMAPSHYLNQCWLRCSPESHDTKVLLTHWSRVTHICVGNLTIIVSDNGLSPTSNLNIIGSDNGLSPGRRQAITWTNVGIMSIGPQGTNFCEVITESHTFSFMKMHLKMSSGKWWPFCLGLNVLSWIHVWRLIVENYSHFSQRLMG